MFYSSTFPAFEYATRSMCMMCIFYDGANAQVEGKEFRECSVQTVLRCKLYTKSYALLPLVLLILNLMFNIIF